MRRLQPKPKERRKVPIPAELRDALREVFEFVQQAKHDPDINLDFDDAIQVGGVLVGGRCGKKPRPYVLIYYPEGDRRRGKWHLRLHRTEIEDIGDGPMKEILMYCCTSPDCRTKFREEGDTCFYCDYEDDEATRNFHARLQELAGRITTKEQWGIGYLREKPDANPLGVIGDYNGIEGLGERLGWFSAGEAEELIAKAKAERE